MTAPTLTPEQQRDEDDARESFNAYLQKNGILLSLHDLMLPLHAYLAAYAAGLARGRAEERGYVCDQCGRQFGSAHSIAQHAHDKHCADAIRAAGAEEAGS